MTAESIGSLNGAVVHPPAPLVRDQRAMGRDEDLETWRA
jgi:hypothetical protein